MRFDVYGRYHLEVVREQGRWVAYHVGEGKRRHAAEVVPPADLDEADLPRYLEDLFHEWASPGRGLRRLS